MCEIGTRKRPHFQQEGGPFFCRILHPPSFRAGIRQTLGHALSLKNQKDIFLFSLAICRDFLVLSDFL